MIDKNNIIGWMVFDKPIGMTSNDLLFRIKRILHPTKIGHAGTLDPMASGVLPVAFGSATRTIEFVMDGEKEYEFTVLFGQKTTTDDAEGEVIQTTEKIPSLNEIQSVLPFFIGKIKQIPPIYSAIKINGKRAYDLARSGQKVDIKEREIEIYDLKMIDFDGRKARFRVQCSKGTYVRSLGRDIAEKIGSLGHIIYLRRIKCGPFKEKDTILLEKLEKIGYKKALFPLSTVLGDISDLALGEHAVDKIRHGVRIKIDFNADEDKIFKVMDGENLVAFVRIENGWVIPFKVFN